VALIYGTLSIIHYGHCVKHRQAGCLYKRLMMDMKFHLALASISQCRIQLKMLQELFDMLLLKYTRDLLLLGIMDSSLNEHLNIFSALEARDSEGLQKAQSTHLKWIDFA
jgi:DNA-binding GntR family transcriptional regulator